MAEQRARQRMPAGLGKARGNGKLAGIDNERRHQFRLPKSERSRLVENHCVDCAELFQRGAILDHHAGAEQPPARHHLHGRNRQTKSTGTRNDQNGDSRHQCRMPAITERQPGNERGRREHMHGGRIKPCQPVGEADIARLTLFGGQHQAHQFGEESIGSRGLHFHQQGRRQIDFPGMDKRARPCCFGCDSPVRKARSMSLVPSIITPSAGIRSPAEMAISIPGLRSRAAL